MLCKILGYMEHSQLIDYYLYSMHNTYKTCVASYTDPAWLSLTNGRKFVD